MNGFAEVARPVLTILYHFDPWGTGVGGIDTLIRQWVKYAPDAMEIRIVGASEQATQLGRWSNRELAGRQIRFLPAIHLSNPNHKRRVPNTLRFAIAIARLGRPLSSDFIHFHRIEPSIGCLRWPGDKTLFFHIDIQKQLSVTRDGNEFGWRRSPSIYHALERRLLPGFAEVLECNSASLDYHRARYPHLAERFRFLRNCVDPDVHWALPATRREISRARVAASLKLPTSTRFALFAGRLQPMKHPQLLVKAFERVKLPDVHLLIAGDGNLREELDQEIHARGLQRRITLLGALPQLELRDLYQVSDAFVLTSTYEGLPVAALEALSCGTPVLTTDSGETPLLLTDKSGIVCRSTCPQQIADALCKLVAGRSDQTSAACSAIAEPFGAAKVLAAEYDRMMDRWRARNPRQQRRRGSR